MNGKQIVNHKMKAIGYGFAGLDLIKNNNCEIYLPGGSSANVMSVLAKLGWHTTMIKTAYSDIWNNYIDNAWKSIGVNIINCSKSKQPTPRVIQKFIGYEHFFYTKCPQCNNQLLSLKLPTANSIRKTNIELNCDVLFFDRISAGTHYLIDKFNVLNKWIFYEPNSMRSYRTFVNNVAKCDIVKFSDRRIPLSAATNLISDLKNIQAATRLIIVTHGSVGMSYTLLNNKEKSDFIPVSVRPLNHIVDSSGAGDWLAAGFINSLLSVYPTKTKQLDSSVVLDALFAGQKEVEECCSCIGATGSLFIDKGIQAPHDNPNCDYCKT